MNDILHKIGFIIWSVLLVVSLGVIALLSAIYLGIMILLLLPSFLYDLAFNEVDGKFRR